MENSNNYDNFLSLFKKNLWDKCLNKQIFNGIPETQVNNAKKIFEDTVENYKSQILQDNNGEALINILLNSIEKETQQLKIITREQLKNTSKEHFENALKAKQNEYDSLMNKNVPETPDFSDGAKDEPLNDDNLDMLIKQHMKERDLSINIEPKDKQQLQLHINKDEVNTEINQVVMNNQISQQHSVAPQLKGNEDVLVNMIQSLQTDNERLSQQITKLENIVDKQLIILNNIVNSQITILKKIK